MVTSFIIFLIVGLLLAVIIEKEYGIIIAIILAIIWGFYKESIWGLIAFIELCVGFGFGLKLKDMSQTKNSNESKQESIDSEDKK